MKKISTLIYSIVSIVVIVVTVAFLRPSYTVFENKQTQIVLKLWQIDSFEGGAGSRTSFLKRIANSFSKENKNVLFLVTSHTKESAENLICTGVYPDIISYGPCGLDIIDKVRVLDGVDVLDGGVQYKKRYAVSWCKGGYFHIKRGNGGNIIVSENVYNSAVVSAVLNKIDISSALITSPQIAYENFIVKQNAELIGSQRDVIRLINRGVEFEATPLKNYNDLFQYVSIMSLDEERARLSEKFITYLLSEKSQKKLNEIKMLSTSFSGCYVDNEYYTELEKIVPEYTVFSLTDGNRLQEIKSAGVKAIKSNNLNELTNLLKQL